MLAISSIVQKFDLSLVDPSYTLELKQALTIKPKGLKIRATLRTTPRRLSTTPSSPLTATAHKPSPHVHAQAADGIMPLYVLYGSNTGTSEAFAQRIASDASAYGQSVSTSLLLQNGLMGSCPGFRSSLGTLDSATEHVPKDGPVIIVTASFEGMAMTLQVSFEVN
jgi:cytochrome P450 / NADPH-cytochrome P450 reductase